MNNNENLHEILNEIRLAEGEGFEFDEAAIAAGYRQGDDNKSSLAIKVLSIFGGFLAAMAFLGFLMIAGLYDSGMGMLIFGTGFIGGAIWLNREYDKLIIDTFSVSAFVIGFVLVGLGLGQLNVDENLVFIIFIAIALCSLSITQNYILSFVSVVIINASILALIITNNGYEFIHAYISVLALVLTYTFLNEAAIITTSKKAAKLYNPVRTGLIFSFLCGLVFPGKRHLIPISPDYIWVSSVVTIASVLYLISLLFKIIRVPSLNHQLLVYAVSLLLLLPTAFSPAISGAILVILLSFFVNYKTGLVTGIIAFIYYLSQYYYDLNFTLLTKSGLLFSSGILFLLLYFFTHKKLTAHEEV